MAPWGSALREGLLGLWVVPRGPKEARGKCFHWRISFCKCRVTIWPSGTIGVVNEQDLASEEGDLY